VSFSHVGVIGAGSWGTALSLLLLGNGLRVTMWAHDSAHVNHVNTRRENSVYLPGVRLPESMGLTAELGDLRDCDLLLVVTPSKAVREISARLAASGVSKRAILLSCTKGVERGSGKRMSEVIAEHFHDHAIAALSGPSHAEEVSRRMPTCVVLGCGDVEIALRLQRAFTAPFFRSYTSDDVAGVELGGALKNIFAIAAGAGDGLGLGDNAKAALVTRALVELGRLGVALGGKRETFMGLSGVGDLMVTCFSRHSRNRAVGERLGKGERLADIVASMQMVAEGVPTAYSAFECARRLGVETPIIDQVKAILDGAISPADAMSRLLGRDPKPE